MLLNGLSPVSEAYYNSSFSTTVKRHECTPETRENILANLKTWALNSNSAKVYWLNGMAGTGKTTIAYTFCKWLEENALLGGNYFCSRISTACSDANKLVPTLAYQLAYYSPSFCEKLYKMLETKPEASKLNIQWQFEQLLLKSFQQNKGTMPVNTIIAIDCIG